MELSYIMLRNSGGCASYKLRRRRGGVEPDARFRERAAHTRIRVRADRAEKLDFGDGTFDFVVMSSVREAGPLPFPLFYNLAVARK